MELFLQLKLFFFVASILSFFCVLSFNLLDCPEVIFSYSQPSNNDIEPQPSWSLAMLLKVIQRSGNQPCSMYSSINLQLRFPDIVVQHAAYRLILGIKLMVPRLSSRLFFCYIGHAVDFRARSREHHVVVQLQYFRHGQSRLLPFTPFAVQYSRLSFLLAQHGTQHVVSFTLPTLFQFLTAVDIAGQVKRTSTSKPSPRILSIQYISLQALMYSNSDYKWHC